MSDDKILPFTPRPQLPIPDDDTLNTAIEWLRLNEEDYMGGKEACQEVATWIEHVTGVDRRRK